MNLKSHMDVFHFMHPHMKETEKICHSFLSQYNLKHFWYSRIYPDGSFMDLGVDPSWFQYMSENNYLGWGEQIRLHPEYWPSQESMFMSTPHSFADSSDLAFFKKELDTITNKYGIYYVFNIIRNKGSYLENFGFSAPIENHLSVSIYSRYFGVLKAFGIYFSQKAASLIHEIERELKGKIFFPFSENYKKSFFASCYDKKNLFNEEKEKWSQSNLKHFFMMTPDGEVSITPRERQCLFHLSAGKTAKEIAVLIKKEEKLDQFSPRTIEQFIDNLKNKTGIRARSGLVRTFIESGL